MATQLTLKEVLGKAIQKEIDSQNLYSELSQKIRDEAAKDAFEELARQEQEHQQLLEQYLRGELKGGTLSKGRETVQELTAFLGRPPSAQSSELERAAHDRALAIVHELKRQN